MYIDVSVVHELYSMEAMGVLDPVRDCYTVCICPDLTETLLNYSGMELSPNANRKKLVTTATNA
jgi:hypothetical protein